MKGAALEGVRREVGSAAGRFAADETGTGRGWRWREGEGTPDPPSVSWRHLLRAGEMGRGAASRATTGKGRRGGGGVCRWRHEAKGKTILFLINFTEKYT
uniref:Uncharacterized protein n=1 Tax=Oryza brachyantha TaxID=4533 RepID=J3L1P3_ORYBR